MYVVTPRCADAASAVVSAVCGAPTTDERIHAPPVLHDASQIAYCRYWGRASLPPITSINRMHIFLNIKADDLFASRPRQHYLCVVAPIRQILKRA